MDWRSVKFDWNHARAFLVTAKEGSLSAAAKALNTTQPTLGRQVSALENELGVALFERHGRGLSLTPTGMQLVQHVQAMSDAANEFSIAASGQSETIAGNVIISAAEMMAAFGLPQLLMPLRQQYPDLNFEVIATKESSDLRRREADIAIRGYRPDQPDLIIKRISNAEVGLYCSKSYLALNEPFSPSRASYIGFDHSDQMINFFLQRGLRLTQANFPLICYDHMVQWEMVKTGLGIGFFPTVIADKEPTLIRVLKELGPIESERWLVTHRELRTSRRIKVVFDYLAEQLSKEHP